MNKYCRAIDHPLFRRYTWMRYEHRHHGVGLEWDSFWHFAEDIEDHLGIPPNLDDMFLLRKDQSKAYTLDNLMWGTRIEQGYRYKRTHRVTYKKRSMSLKQWAIELGVPYATLYTRLRMGFSPKKILGL